METNNIADIVDHILERVSAGSLEINWRSAATQSAGGQRKGSRKGPGFEHHGFKEYDPADGDQASHIDPSASAAESEDDVYIVRVYKRPRVTCLTVLADVSESLNMGTILGGFKSYLVAIATGCGIKAADKSGDRATLVTYADQPITFHKARDPKGLLFPAIYSTIEDRKLPTPVFEGFEDWRSWLGQKGRDAASAVLESVRHIFSRKIFQGRPEAGGGLAISLEATHRELRSVYMVVSDFVNMNEADWDALQACGTTHDAIAVYVQDKRERELPKVLWPGMSFRLKDYRGETLSLWIAPDNSPQWYLNAMGKVFGSSTTRARYQENWKRHEEKILQRLQDCGVTTIVVSTDDEDEAIQQLLQVLASKTRS